MSHTFKLFIGKPYPLGATWLSKDEVNFAVVLNTVNTCGVILYNKNTNEEIRIPFQAENKIGNIYCIKIKAINKEQYEYNFFDGESIFTDPYAKIVKGNEKWGITPKQLKAGFYDEAFEWDDDKPLMMDYNDAIFYLLHVRGFTNHSSSKVKEKGKYEGIIEKIPYLKELNINTLEVMPCYEFIEMDEPGTEDDCYSDNLPKLNYWGYKNAYYFAPKSSYSANALKDSTKSLKNLVKQLHKNGIEIIMQFYFPDDITPAYILEVLKYWVYEYHIDGMHLIGTKIPTSLLGTEPMLANTKLIYHEFWVDDIYSANKKPSYKNLAISNDSYMYDIRKFLKSDEGMLQRVLYHLKNDLEKTAIIHYITHTNGFTLSDLVSYERKHNEDNGEHNYDGNPYNCSWNCGVEGKTRKKTIQNLRLKQMKNAFILNMLTKSTPLILSGDEFGNSQEGNNNPYCQDNQITWLNWKDLEKNNELFQFVKELIKLRNEHPILHINKQYQMTDYLGCSYPDLSYHGEEAWKVETDDLTRHFAMLYCSQYANDIKLDNSLIYVAMNMHWSDHEFGLPKLPKDKQWYLIMDTDKNVHTKSIVKDQKRINVTERSIKILIGE